MAIEVTRSPLKIDQIVGEQESQALIDTDIIVPESKPDVGKILDIIGHVFINSKEVIQDRAMVEGTIRYNILYTEENDRNHIDSMEGEASFTHYVEIPGAKPKMTVDISVNLEHIDYDIINSRKLNTKAVLDIGAAVRQLMQLEVIDGFGRDSQVEALKEEIKLSYDTGQGTAHAVIRESIELDDDMPTIKYVLRKNLKIKDVEYTAADNKVLVNGIADIGFLYVCEDDEYPMQYLNKEIEFVHDVEIPGAYQGMDCQASIAISDFYIEPKEDINGENRLAEVEMMLGFEAKIYDTQTKEVVVDAYSTDVGFDIKRRKVLLTDTIGKNQSQTVIKEDISLPDNIPALGKVIYVDANALLSDQRISEERVIIEGVLLLNIIYQSKDEDKLLGSYAQEIPFRQSVEIEGATDDMDCHSTLTVDRVSFSIIAPDEVEIRAVVNAVSDVFKAYEKDVLTGIEEVELEADQESGIFVYFVKPGDNLWTVAKRYSTTINNLLRYNDIADENSVEVGKKIIVYKKYDFKKEMKSVQG